MEIFSMSDVGSERELNEDSVYHSKKRGILAVADGVGGHLAGEFASRKSVELLVRELRVIPKIITQKFLTNIVKKINNEIFNISLSNEKYDGMGSTLVFAVARKGRMYITNIGDSRAYLLRAGLMKQITIDHSHVQQLLEKGKISQDDMRWHHLKNVITKSLGTRVAEDPDVFDIGIEKGDLFLLCSDGLSNMLSDAEIKDTILKNHSVKRAARKLIDLANKRGGRDNISAGIMKTEPGDIDD